MSPGWGLYQVMTAEGWQGSWECQQGSDRKDGPSLAGEEGK